MNYPSRPEPRQAGGHREAARLPSASSFRQAMALPAGRLLDQFVHELVFSSRCETPPRYSSDGEACKLIESALADRKWTLNVDQHRTSKLWCAEPRHWDWDVFDFSICAPTLPLAIAKAAIVALSVAEAECEAIRSGDVCCWVKDFEQCRTWKADGSFLLLGEVHVAILSDLEGCSNAIPFVPAWELVRLWGADDRDDSVAEGSLKGRHV